MVQTDEQPAGVPLAVFDGFREALAANRAETDQTADLEAITVPVLVLQGDDDQVVPYQEAALQQARLLQNATLKVYKASPGGC